MASTLFEYFTDGHRLVVVVGEGVTGKQAGWALPYCLSEIVGRSERALHLVLPATHAFATTQRIPWLKLDAQPTVWAYQNGHVELVLTLSRDATVANVVHWAETHSKGSALPGPGAELVQASTPAHLGPHSRLVEELVEWATSHPQLDASHLQGSRVWHCAGQRVLSIERHAGCLVIRAGIHDARRAAHPDVTLAHGTPLSPADLDLLKDRTGEGVQARLGGKYFRADEHWLQSVIRRHPSLVGVESPALREVPAWRPAGGPVTFGRGFLDLLGLDGHGDIRLVEAKLAKSSDDMTLMQGLDYHVWALGYRDAIAAKLSAPRKARLRLHYAIGWKHGDTQVLPPRVYKYAYALDTDAVPFRVHVITGWDTLQPDPCTAVSTRACPTSTLPTLDDCTPST